MSVALRLQRTCVWLYVGALALQFYAAGLALFGLTSFMSHALLGYGLILGALTLLALTSAARLGRRHVGLAVGVLALVVLQPVLAVGLRGQFPWMAALHPVVALVIFGLALEIGRSTRAPGPGGAPDSRRAVA